MHTRLSGEKELPLIRRKMERKEIWLVLGEVLFLLKRGLKLLIYEAERRERNFARALIFRKLTHVLRYAYESSRKDQIIPKIGMIFTYLQRERRNEYLKNGNIYICIYVLAHIRFESNEKVYVLENKLSISPQ